MKKLQIAVALTVLFGVPAILFAGASIVHLIAQVPTLISSGTTSTNVAHRRMIEEDTTVTGQWVEHCRGLLTLSKDEEATWPQWTCFVYIDSIFGALGYSRKICPPKTILTKDMIKIVVTTVDHHPERLDKLFQHVIIYTLVEAWPCPTRPRWLDQ